MTATPCLWVLQVIAGREAGAAGRRSSKTPGHTTGRAAASNTFGGEALRCSFDPKFDEDSKGTFDRDSGSSDGSSSDDSGSDGNTGRGSDSGSGSDSELLPEGWEVANCSLTTCSWQQQQQRQEEEGEVGQQQPASGSSSAAGARDAGRASGGGGGSSGSPAQASLQVVLGKVRCRAECSQLVSMH